MILIHRIVLFLFMVAILGVTSAMAAPQEELSFIEAYEVVLKKVCRNNTRGIRIYGLEQNVKKGEKIPGWHDEVIIPHTGYLFFIDNHPLANWQHECTWVFVSLSRQVTSFKKRTPPRDAYLLRMKELTDSKLYPGTTYEKIRQSVKEKQQKLFGADKYENQPNDITGNRYALLISGGASMGNNHIRYWGDIAFIYRALINYYGYDKSNIVVCMSDGDDPTVDRSDGTDSPLDLDGDGLDDYSLDATYTTVTAELQNLVDTAGPDDLVFIFTTDHGGNDNPALDDVFLNLWDWEILEDYEFADYVDQLPVDTLKIITMEQCHSGGFIDDISDNGTSNVVMSTAAGYWESSWAGDTYPEFNEYVYEWISAVNWATDDIYGTPASTDADTDISAICEIYEAHQWAVAHDDASESPQWLDNDSIGQEVSLWGRISQDNLDIVQVLDRSGSMGGYASASSTDTKIEALRLASDHFVQVMEPDIGNQLGLVQFNEDVVPFDPACEADLAPLTTTRASLLRTTTIPSIINGGNTSIGDGLAEAHAQLTGPSAIPEHQKSILLISDGKENRSAWISDVQSDLIADNITVYPLGLGYSTGIDETKLIDLANATGGDYRITSDELEFRKFFLEMLAYSLDWSVITDPTGTIAGGDSVLIPIPITKDDTIVTFNTFWEGSGAEGALKVTLIGPSGNTIDPADSDHIRYIKEDFYSFYQLKFPLTGIPASEWTGNWILKIENIGHNTGVRYAYAVYSDSDIKFQFAFDKLQHLTGDKIIIKASLKEGLKPVTASIVHAVCDVPLFGIGNLLHNSDISRDRLKEGLTINGEPISLADQKLELLKHELKRGQKELRLYDDGKHNDAEPNDGIYAAAFDKTEIAGSYNFRVVASGIRTDVGEITSREWTKCINNAVNIDPSFSRIKVYKYRNRLGIRYYITIVPMDSFKNYLGPGSEVKGKIPNIKQKDITFDDRNVDGTYKAGVFLTYNEIEYGQKIIIYINNKYFTTIKL